MINKDKNVMKNELTEKEIKKVNGGKTDAEKAEKLPWGKDKGGSLGDYYPTTHTKPSKP